jgi:K+-sensing histidine kinase KdpD
MKVVNDGSGLDSEEIKTLFHQENYGLYNCKSLIEQMGGNITIENKLGSGTSYSINFKTVCRVNKENFGRNLHSRCKNKQSENPFLVGFLD